MGEDVVAEQHEHLRAARERFRKPDRLGKPARLLLQLVGQLEAEVAARAQQLKEVPGVLRV